MTAVYASGTPSALSSRELQVLQFLRRSITELRSPTFQEIANGTGLKSKSQVHHAVFGLRTKGWIRFDPYTRRSIELSDPFSAKSTADLLAMRQRIDAVLAGRAQ